MPRLAAEALDARRHEIVAAAIRAFARRGLHGTTMRDIFKEAGLSAGAVYNYFRSKEEIVVAVVESNTQASIAVLEQVGGSQPQDDAFLRIVDTFFGDLEAAGADGRARMAQLIAAEACVSPELGALLRDRRDRIRMLAARHVAAVRPLANETERARLLDFVLHLYEGMLATAALGEPIDVEGMRAVVDHVLTTYPGGFSR